MGIGRTDGSMTSLPRLPIFSEATRFKLDINDFQSSQWPISHSAYADLRDVVFGGDVQPLETTGMLCF